MGQTWFVNLTTNATPFRHGLAKTVPAGTVLQFTHVTTSPALGASFTNAFTRFVAGQRAIEQRDQIDQGRHGVGAEDVAERQCVLVFCDFAVACRRS